MIHNKTKLCFLLALACLGSAALAAPEAFDFKDPKGVNNAAFKLDAPLEAVNGNATGISGTVTFDPADPAATQGKIVVASSSLHLCAFALVRISALSLFLAEQKRSARQDA